MFLMQLSDIFLRLGQDHFQQLLRLISIGKLKTYQLFDRVKTRMYLQKLNAETLRKAGPRVWARIEERDDEFAAEIARPSWSRPILARLLDRPPPRAPPGQRA